jgi:Na+-driven multidrug efflux pump
MQTVFAGLSTGATVVTARVTGEGDNEKVRHVLIQALFMSIFAGVLVTIPCYIFSSGILRLFFSAAEKEVITLALTFFDANIGRRKKIHRKTGT